jgi:hypothetical protein
MDEETITRGELNAALIRLRYAILNAGEIFKDVKAHREPKWAAFDLVQDAEGVVWQMSPSGSWWKMGQSGLFLPAVPVRPLVKLGNAKPEGN